MLHDVVGNLSSLMGFWWKIHFHLHNWQKVANISISAPSSRSLNITNIKSPIQYHQYDITNIMYHNIISPTFLLSGVSPFATVPGGKKSKEIIILLIIIITDALIVIDVDFAGGSFEKFSRAWTSTADKHAKVSKLSATHPHNCHAPLRSPLQCNCCWSGKARRAYLRRWRLPWERTPRKERQFHNCWQWTFSMYRFLIYTLVFPLDIRTSGFIIQPKNMPGLKFEALGKDATERATVS